MNQSFTLKLFIKSILPKTVLLGFLFIVIVTSLIYAILISQTKGELKKTADLIHQDLILKDSKWDLSLYNADNNISDSNPLYIITSEGFVVERSRLIHGLLDFSRYTYINQYLTPTTVDAVTGESWRVLAAPVMSQDEQVGLIFTSIYNPNLQDLSNIDQLLQSTINRINTEIAAEGDSIDISKIDARQLPYQISFQIVSRFNKVLFQSNNTNSVTRMPTFMDRSYVESQLKGPSYKEISDAVTKIKYLTFTKPILNEKNLLAGIIVVGIPINNIYFYLQILLAIISFLLTVIGIVFMPFIFKKLQKLHQYNEKAKQKIIPTIITFNKKECKLIIGKEIVDIPFASHQYYFCQSLFQKPQKKWEVDELLEIFGEDFGPDKWRKVYDTMIALNRKTSHLIERLFIVKGKRYFINAQFREAIQISNS